MERIPRPVTPCLGVAMKYKRFFRDMVIQMAFALLIASAITWMLWMLNGQ